MIAGFLFSFLGFQKCGPEFLRFYGLVYLLILQAFIVC
jgi:hypothetical protein